MTRTLRRFLRTALLSLGSTLVLLIILGCAVTCRPSWYQPGAIDVARLEDDKRDLVRLLDGVGDALNQSLPIDIELDEAQVNRWIAARRELPLDLEDPAVAAFADVLGQLESPCVRFLGDDRIRLGAMVEYAGFRTVAAASLKLVLEDGRVRIAPDGVSAGVLPLPARALLRRVDEAVAGQGGAGPVFRDGAAEAPDHGRWPNGKRPFRVARLSVVSGRLQARLVPLE